MADSMKLAVPTMGAAGLDAQRSGHFGHCDVFTVIDIRDGEVVGFSAVENNHDTAGCLGPVQLLADAGVDAIVAAGMGMRPLMGFQDAGITVLFEPETPGVGDVARKVAAGDVPTMSTDAACQHHH